MKVSTGEAHTLYLTGDGKLWAAGHNDCGQLGDGTLESRTIPVQIATNVTDIAAGWNHSLFITADGQLWAMGQNTYGQLGLGLNDYTDRHTPVPVPGVTNAATVTAGQYFTHYITRDHELWGMGYNLYYQVGAPNAANGVPVRVATNVATASAGGSHTLFTTLDGNLWATGYNYNGQLGNATNTTPYAIVQVTTAANVTAISAGLYHSLYLTADGALYAMGDNTRGQLGDNSTTSRNTPVRIATNVAAISAGDYFSLFTTKDGALHAMGANNYGQLGDNDIANHLAPVQVAGAANVTAISAGGDHSAYVTNGNTLWATGANNYGQLGNGTFEKEFTPILTYRAPALLAPLADQTTPAGQPATFIIPATALLAAPAPDYQWQLNATPIAPTDPRFTGAATATLTLHAATPDLNNATFTCLITNTVGAITTNPAHLTITGTLPPTGSAPSITSPLTITGSVGAPLTYQIAATNNPTTYAAVNLPNNLSLDTTCPLTPPPASSPAPRPSPAPTPPPSSPPTPTAPAPPSPNSS